MSESTTRSPLLSLLVFGAGLFVTALVLSSCAHTTSTSPAAVSPVAPPPATAAATTPPNGFPDPASACEAGGGKYLGDMKCQKPDGSVWPILSSVDKQRMMLSGIPVPPKSPHAWALATTAMIFEMNSHRHDLLSGTAATPAGQQTGKRLLSQGWSINNRDDLLRTLTWLQFQGHRYEFEELGRRVIPRRAGFPICLR